MTVSFLGPVDRTGLDASFSAEEKQLTLKVRTFVDDVIRPNIADWDDRAVFRTEIISEVGRLGVLGIHLDGYGCPGHSAVEHGLVAQELEVWGVMGAAKDSVNAVLDYSATRRQFGTPLGGFHLTQATLADMAAAINKRDLLAHQIGRVKDGVLLGTHSPSRISTGKLDNCRVAIGIAPDAREMLGGNGVALDYSPLRHANNLESVRTYEGTDEVHQLTIGRHLTGVGAVTTAGA